MGIPSLDLDSSDDPQVKAQELVKKVQIMLHAKLGVIEKGVVADLVLDLGNFVNPNRLEENQNGMRTGQFAPQDPPMQGKA